MPLDSDPNRNLIDLLRDSGERGPVRPVVLMLLVFAQMVPFVMLYAPLAAYLVEAFPANVRYTSISPSVQSRQRVVRRHPAPDRDGRSSHGRAARSHGWHIRSSLRW
jgi:hypothetical protein